MSFKRDVLKMGLLRRSSIMLFVGCLAAAAANGESGLMDHLLQVMPADAGIPHVS